MQSSRVRLMLVALFGVLALGALTAAAAQAVEAPRWSISGTDLAEGKTHYISAKKYSSTFVRAANITLSCEVFKFVEGSLLGSTAGNAGKGNGVIEFTKCTVVGKTGGKEITKCKVNEPIRTKAVKAELVETAGAVPGTSGSLLMLFEPAEGAIFERVGFTTEAGGVCPPETNIAGQVVGQVLTDPEKEPELGKLVELPSVNSAEAKSWLINFPSTPITKVTKINNGRVSEVGGIELEAFSETVTLEGAVLFLLAKKNEKTGLLESETTLWSPLP
jgi:hypothetical protein